MTTRFSLASSLAVSVLLLSAAGNGRPESPGTYQSFRQGHVAERVVEGARLRYDQCNQSQLLALPDASGRYVLGHSTSPTVLCRPV